MLDKFFDRSTNLETQERTAQLAQIMDRISKGYWGEAESRSSEKSRLSATLEFLYANFMPRGLERKLEFQQYDFASRSVLPMHKENIEAFAKLPNAEQIGMLSWLEGLAQVLNGSLQEKKQYLERERNALIDRVLTRREFIVDPQTNIQIDIQAAIQLVKAARNIDEKYQLFGGNGFVIDHLQSLISIEDALKNITTLEIKEETSEKNANSEIKQ
jgi:hypothetical protein